SNVLVETGQQARPLLIDASMYGPGHWGLDSARLLVDLVLRVRRPGVPSMLWTDLAESAEFALALCRYGGGSIDPVDAVEAFVAQVVNELPTYLRFEPLEINRFQW